ncbi:uncharacterized [Tachysurus ichikawai]
MMSSMRASAPPSSPPFTLSACIVLCKVKERITPLDMIFCLHDNLPHSAIPICSVTPIYTVEASRWCRVAKAKSQR